MIIWILFKICVWQKVVVIAEVIVNACMYFCCGLYNFTQRKQTSFFWFGCNKMKSSMIIWIFFSRWELSEEEESGGSDVETLVNQKQTAVSETLHKTPGCCKNMCTSLVASNRSCIHLVKSKPTMKWSAGKKTWGNYAHLETFMHERMFML